MKKHFFLLLLSSFNFSGFSQVADYFTTGYHIQKYDTFLEDFTKETEPCFKSNTFKLSITSVKMRIEIEDSSINSENTSRDSYVKDIVIGPDLPVDSGALFHKSFQGVMKKLILDDAFTKTGIPKYQTLKFTGRMYSHKINFDDFIGDKADNVDVYFRFIYENGEKDNMRLHLSQKSPSQIESDNLKEKMKNDFAEIQNQKQKQLQEQQQIFEEQERLRKAQKAEKNIQDVNSIMNQLINAFKK
jgi:hypothetical protein